MNLAEQFHENCGFGLLAHIHNLPSHSMLEDAIKALSRMMHPRRHCRRRQNR